MTERTALVPYWGTKNRLPIDPTAYEVQRTFKTGQCHSFARALHRLTGWPLVVLCYDDDYVGEVVEDPFYYASSNGDHVVVERPDGMYVDIDGAWPPGQNFSDLSVPVYLTDKQVAQLGWDRQDVRAARHFAKALLDEVEGVRYPA